MKLVQRLTQDYVHGSNSVKDTIVFHFTAGSTLAGAESTLAKPDTINVHFIIDRDGTIYQYLEEPQWAYHTGDTAWSKRSFGVEIVNWGPLVFQEGVYLPWTLRKNQAVPANRVQNVSPFRGYQFFEKLSNSQVQACLELIPYLRQRNPIRKLITHAMVNKNKSDYPPDYPQMVQILATPLS